MSLTIEESKFKELFKLALAELIEERKDFIQEMILEVIEDIGLVNAIKESENSEIVSEDEVFQILDGVS